MTLQPGQPGSARHRQAPPGLSWLAIGLGSALGLATALVALAIAELVTAAANAPIGAPVDAVGELSIDHVPSSIKNFAIREFGSHDKTVLLWGIWVVLLIFAAIIGVAALRRLWLGLAGLAVFVGIGLYAAESQPTATARDALPTIVGGLAAAGFMAWAAGLARRAIMARWLASTRGTRLSPAAPSPDREEPRPDSEPVTPPASQPGDAAPKPEWQRWRPTGEEPQPAEPQPAAAGADRPRAFDPAVVEAGRSRRNFLLVSAGAAVASVGAYKVGAWVAQNRVVAAAQQSLKLPAAATRAAALPAGYDLKIPGLSPFITPNSKFYRVDTAIVLPEVLPATWRLRIHGMVRRELVLSFHDLIKRPLIEDWITLCCVSNWVGGPYIGNAKWLGASLRSLLQEAGIQPGAEQLLCTSADGFTSGTPVQTAMDGRDALLAVGMNDTALPVAHGFPVRLVIPGLYGYVSACKWLTDIEVTTYAASTSYWAQRGWSAQAPIKTESRIDVPALGGASIKSGSSTAVAGVAWAQHKGIEAVEVRIDRGPWREAQLASVPDIDTWRQWVYHWDASVPAGTHLIEARATDKTGYTQTSLQEPPEPNGASGYPQVQVTVGS